MRQIAIVAGIIVVVTAIVSEWGTNAIIAQASKGSAATAASGSVEVMRMMTEIEGFARGTVRRLLGRSPR